MRIVVRALWVCCTVIGDVSLSRRAALLPLHQHHAVIAVLPGVAHIVHHLSAALARLVTPARSAARDKGHLFVDCGVVHIQDPPNFFLRQVCPRYVVQ